MKLKHGLRKENEEDKKLLERLFGSKEFVLFVHPSVSIDTSRYNRHRLKYCNNILI